MIIRKGTLHLGEGTELLQTDIRLSNGRIHSMGKDLPEDGEVEIDASGKHVLPGLIDPGCTVGVMGLPSRYPDHNETSHPLHPEMNLKYSLDPDEMDLQEYYRSGITALGYMPGNSTICGGLGFVVKTTAGPGKKIVKEKAILKCSVTGAVKEQFGEKDRLPMTRMGIFYLLEQMFHSDTKWEGVEDQANSVIQQVKNGEMPLCVAAEKTCEIQGIIEFARREGIPLTIQDGFGFSACKREMMDAKTGLILGNLSSLSQKTKHKIDLSVLNELSDSGICIGLSTSNGGYSEGREVLLWNAAELYRGGIDKENVVTMMTRNPARLLGVEDRMGTLEPGKDGDVVIFSHHPVTSYQAKVEYCIIDGRVVWHG